MKRARVHLLEERLVEAFGRGYGFPTPSGAFLQV